MKFFDLELDVEEERTDLVIETLEVAFKVGGEIKKNERSDNIGKIGYRSCELLCWLSIADLLQILVEQIELMHKIKKCFRE